MDKSEYISELRLTILQNSLLHEFLITKSLADILEIDFQDSYTLGDKSSSLSLASKIHLLIDLKKLSKEFKTKLFYYLEIRNQFLHNWITKTFVDCFNRLDGTKKALFKLYKPDTNDSEEEQLAFCYNKLSKDIVDIFVNHLTDNVISTKSDKERGIRERAKYKELRDKQSNFFLEFLESDHLKKYDITESDKTKMIMEMVNKLMF